MASSNDEGSNSGRRTRSGRKISTPQTVASPVRATRRSYKKVQEVSLIDGELEEITKREIEREIVPQQSDIIKEMLEEAAQGVIVTEECEDGGGDDSNIIEIPDGDVEDLVEELHKEDYDDCIIYEEEAIEHQGEDVEMYTIQEEEPEQVTETPAHSSTAAIDEKSSSFPFGTVIQSETSDDVQNEEEIEEENNDDVATGGIVENSLLASLAGDNANSLPSVGGGEEGDSKKDDFDGRAEEQKDTIVEKMESDDSLSEPAVAEEILDGDCIDASNATIVNTEMVSEDELPMPTKPEINDAEEVSDDELPAPQRAELPPDAEVISEDELPTNATVDKKSPSASPKSNASTTNRQKRKVDDTETETSDNGSNNEKSQRQSDDFIQSSKSEQYNPMSPTSESNDGTPPLEKKAKIDEEESSNEAKEKKKETKEKEKEKEKEKDKEKEKEKEKKRLPDLDKYWRSVKEDPTDFTGWTYLLQYVDNESDAEAAREAYDAFLAHYPYCYGYWRKYADYEKRKGIKANCNTVFERGLEAIPLSVDLWIHYLSHVKSTTSSSDEDFIRAQFESAINACGLEFRSDKLWDAYIKWENDNKRYQRVVQIYDRLLAIPTQGYSGHFDNFQDLINQHSITMTIGTEELVRIRTEVRESLAARSSKSKERTSTSSSKDKDHKESSKTIEKDHKESSKGSDKEHKETTKSSEKDKDARDSKDSDSSDKKTAKQESKDQAAVANETCKENQQQSESSEAASKDVKQPPAKEVNLSDLSTLTDNEISLIKDKIISIRRKLHKNTVAAVTARWTFEEGIKRPYFHVKPLERCQLKNWKDYLDFEIEKGDRKRILVLFERCLIACALYEEFWLKMIRYLETIIDEPNIPKVTSDVYRRACEIHHPDKPSLHLMWSAFEECQNNFDKAAEVLVGLEKKCPNLLQVAYRRINVERRRGDTNKCKELYEHYIATAKNKSVAGSLTVKYARFLNKICHDIDSGMRVLRQTLEKDPGNTRVALQMIDLTLQRDKVDEDEVVLIMDKFMARENIDPEQKVLFAQRKVEFLEDFGSSARGLQEAQRGLQLALSKANEAKKKRESSPSRKASASSKDGMSGSSMGQTTAYNNGANAAGTNYNYNSANSAYYGQQNSGAYQQPYDGYYNQWQYGSSSGYGGYSQWSGYGNYY